jgi:hypothetical protein
MSILAAPTIQKAEDAAHVSGDRGTVALGVRKDTATSLAGTDGDYTSAIFDANGRLHVVAPSLGTAYKWLNAPAIGMTAITYQGEDVIGGLITISAVTNTKAFELKNIILRARDVGIVKDYMIIFFDSDPSASTFTDGDTVTINTANKDNVTLMLPVNEADFLSVGSGGTYFASAPKDVNKVLGSTGTLYAVIVAKEEIIATAAALELSIGVIQD